MKVKLSKVNGIEQAIKALYTSKRNLTEEKESEIELICLHTLTPNGAINYDANEEELNKLFNYLDKLFKYGKKHLVLLSFIDLSFTVRDLHRAGQDDWDSHAERFDNRIVRNSTRLANFNGEEKSDYYKDKIITMDEYFRKFNIYVPYSIEIEGVEYVKATNGYIRADLKDNNDVKRGLYMECIPSTFVYTCNLSEFGHVYKMRNKNTTAHPEVQQCCEMCVDAFKEYHLDKWINRELLLELPN